MSKEFVANHLDLVSFAQAGAELTGQEPLGQFERLRAEAQGDAADRTVDWNARGESRPVQGGADEIWLHLYAQASLPMICQRCLTPVDVSITVDRPFRFAPDEEAAAALDEASDEDVLALSRAFDLPVLVEDELLMEIPVVPRHETCPVPVKLVAADKAYRAKLRIGFGSAKETALVQQAGQTDPTVTVEDTRSTSDFNLVSTATDSVGKITRHFNVARVRPQRARTVTNAARGPHGNCLAGC